MESSPSAAQHGRYEGFARPGRSGQEGRAAAVFHGVAQLQQRRLVRFGGVVKPRIGGVLEGLLLQSPVGFVHVRLSCRMRDRIRQASGDVGRRHLTTATKFSISPVTAIPAAVVAARHRSSPLRRDPLVVNQQDGVDLSVGRSGQRIADRADVFQRPRDRPTPFRSAS